MQSRRLHVVTVLLVVEGFGLGGLLLFLALRGTPPPTLVHLLPAIGAGAAGTVALAAFYRALAIGTMSIVAPISATGVAVPVAVGLAGGEHPATTQLAGMACAVVGVILASREADGGDEKPDGAPRVGAVWLSLLAAAGFGTFFVGLRSSARWDVAWSLAAARMPAVLMLVAAAVVLRIPPRAGRDRVSALALGGGLDVAANGLYALATHHGLLSVVAVASSLYPLGTVILARTVLRERVRRVQEVGIVAALAGVVLIAAG